MFYQKGEMKQLVKLLKTYASLVVEYEKDTTTGPEEMDYTIADVSVDDLKHMTV